MNYRQGVEGGEAEEEEEKKVECFYFQIKSLSFSLLQASSPWKKESGGRLNVCWKSFHQNFEIRMMQVRTLTFAFQNSNFTFFE